MLKNLPIMLCFTAYFAQKQPSYAWTMLTPLNSFVQKKLYAEPFLRQ